MNIVKTIFICVVLGGGIYLFRKDTNDLVLEPIEKMTKKIISEKTALVRKLTVKK